MASYTTTNQPLPYQVPYLQDYWARAQDVANQPYQASPSQYVAPNPYEQASWQATANRAMEGSPVMGAANQTLQNIVSGGMMNGNPYLDQQISNAQADTVKAWNNVAKPAWDTAMQRSGSFGNHNVMAAAADAGSTLQQNLGRISSDMRSRAYDTERGYMQQALGMAPTFAAQDYYDAAQLGNAGMQMRNAQQGAADQNYRWWQEAQNYPRQQLGLLGQSLGIGGGSQQTVTQPDPSTLSKVVGGALVGSQLGNLFGGWNWLGGVKP